MRTLISALLLALPGAALASDVVPDTLEGTYRAIGGDRDQALEEIIHEMPFYKRPFARNQLQDATRPCSEVRIDEQDGKVRITCDDRPPALDAPDGQWTTYTTDQGEQIDLLIQLDGERIVQRFRTDRGVRTNVYSVHDGSLRIDTALESGRLPRTLRYHRSFRSVDGARRAS